jgi:hypothetical protein
MRLQDILFGIFGAVVVALLVLHLRVAVFALVGAFACGSVYVFAGMVPSRNESFGTRAFTSGFLAVVASSLVLILPGTFGAVGPDATTVVLVIAGLLPPIAVGFEVVRTPRVRDIILRALGYR